MENTSFRATWKYIVKTSPRAKVFATSTTDASSKCTIDTVDLETYRNVGSDDDGANDSRLWNKCFNNRWHVEQACTFV